MACYRAVLSLSVIVSEAFFSSTWFPTSLPSLTPSMHKAYSEMLYFEEHMQRETFKQIRPDHRSIFLLLFVLYLRVGYLWCPALNWGFLCTLAHPHSHICQQCLLGAQLGTTCLCPCHPLGHNALVTQWKTGNRQPPITPQP